MHDWRLSRVIQRGGETEDERARLSRLLGVSERILFGPGLPVRLRSDERLCL